VPVAGIIVVKVGNQTHFDMSSLTTKGSKVDITMTYKGVTTVPVVPMTLAVNNSKGWYDNQIITEIKEKTGQDATGYRLTNEEYNVKEWFWPGGRFAYLKTIVISQQPHVSMTLSKVNIKDVSSHFREHTSVNVDLFGFIPLGKIDNTYEVTKVSIDENMSTVTINFGPTENIASEKGRAFIIGGEVLYPPAN
jgi:hypothetical protein